MSDPVTSREAALEAELNRIVEAMKRESEFDRMRERFHRIRNARMIAIAHELSWLNTGEPPKGATAPSAPVTSRAVAKRG